MEKKRNLNRMFIKYNLKEGQKKEHSNQSFLFSFFKTLFPKISRQVSLDFAS